jgi:hypothetical protein
MKWEPSSNVNTRQEENENGTVYSYKNENPLCIQEKSPRIPAQHISLADEQVALMAKFDAV